MLMYQRRMGNRRSVVAIVGMNILMPSILRIVPSSLLGAPVPLVPVQCRMGILHSAVVLLDHAWLAVDKRNR